jgi:Lhr-like helicase
VVKKILYASQPSIPIDRGAHVSLTSLAFVCDSLNILTEPCAVQFISEAVDELSRVRVSEKIEHAQDEIMRFLKKAQDVYEELGLWAADHYILASISNFKDALFARVDYLLEWDNFEKNYVNKILARVLDRMLRRRSDDPSKSAPMFSPKVETLVQFLNKENKDNFSCLIFAERRATAAVLCHLLCHHPTTREWLRCGSFVGMSAMSNRKTLLGDLLEMKRQKTTLADFRDGTKNVVVCTSVLEEGIDVSSCHLVICFNKPLTLKSFIQRRGRARKSCSTYVLMLAEDDPFTKDQRWNELEKEMIRTYLDDTRKLAGIEEHEKAEVTEGRSFRVEATGCVCRLFVKLT